MDAHKKASLMAVLLISLCIACFDALFWGVWYLIKGEVLVIAEYHFLSLGWYQLPFDVSRLWDIPFSFVITALLFTRIAVLKSESRKIDPLTNCLFLNLIFCLIFGTVSTLELALFFTPIVVLVYLAKGVYKFMTKDKVHPNT